MSRLIDISPPLSAHTAVWPGDVDFSRSVSLSMAAGGNFDLSSITTTLHVGSHADAPSHYRAGASAIDAVSLDPYYGPAQVVRVAVARGARILPPDLPEDIRAPRVLFRTDTFPDPRIFNEDFASLSPDLVSYLAARRVVLVGIDTPSVDPFASKALESHQALADRGILNIEGLVLSHVAPGDYTLIALPLRIEGADASPVRAVLVPLQASTPSRRRPPRTAPE